MASTDLVEKSKLYRLYEEPQHVEIYSKYRPDYPPELKQQVLSYMEENGFSSGGSSFLLDIGCGTGIVMRLFAPCFTSAWGIDISQEQIKHAVDRSSRNEFYLKSPAEATCFKDRTFDLITVGQAWHWFDHDKFNAEVSRILAPNGFLVIFGYATPFQLSPQFEAAQAIMHKFYDEKLAPFYSERVKLLYDRYTDIELPFTTRHRIDGVELRMEVPLSWILDYLSTQVHYQAMDRALPGNNELERLRKELIVAIGGSDVGGDFNPILDVTASIFVEIARKTN